VPIKCYRDYIYKDGFDETKYIIGDGALLYYLDVKKSASISKGWITRDEDNFYVLKSDKTFTIKPFTLSRELAIQEALGKLTDEEKKLLGL
jgi:hypothetical protein